MTLRIDAQPISLRPFYGLGAQADGFLYNRVNARYGITSADLALVERRLNALKLANARMFVSVPWFNPSLDGRTFRWGDRDYRLCVDQIRRHQANGTACNLVLFQPMFPSAEQVPAVVTAMVAMIARLVTREGLDNVRWLTLWNESDSIFPHDTPLMRRVFGAKRIRERPHWPVYAKANRLAYRLLGEQGLSGRVQLIVPDCVWGAPVRAERMHLAVAAFPKLDPAYAYHVYNPEDLSFYKGNPNYAYPGVAREAASFRRLVGPDRPLLIAEFNAAGHGFGSYFAGVGIAGSDLVGSVPGAVAVTDKVLRAAANGVDGFTLWCLHDLVYGEASGVMPFGLWRFKPQNWVPRPVYHYYGALIDVLRPGVRLHRVQGQGEGLSALACRREGKTTLLLLNTTSEAVSVAVAPGAAVAAARRRVIPAAIPPLNDLPFASTERVKAARGGLALTVEPAELTMLALESEEGRTK